MGEKTPLSHLWCLTGLAICSESLPSAILTPLPESPLAGAFSKSGGEDQGDIQSSKSIRNTAANNAASGKNLAIRKPTPRNTEEHDGIEIVGIS